MPDSRLTLFFSVFSKSIQDEILDFCRRISSEKADVYIFLARKAAVFCDCLEELGQIHLDGYVTTDRSLDIDGNWLAGKDVIIIDDAVVSGTTLYATIQKLKNYGVRKIMVQILTINNRWYNSELLENEAGESYVYPVYNKLPDNMCIKLCNDIVQAISLVPRPYDIDFPLYQSISIPENDLNRILVLNNWYSHDIRTERQKNNHIINVSLMPNKTELRELSNAFGLDVSENCIVKIRIFGRLVDKDKRSYSLRIAPMIVFNEMKSTTVKQVFNRIVSVSRDSSLFSEWGSTAQLRFLQFYYSNHLSKFWLYRISPFVTLPHNLIYSYRNLSFLFPEDYIQPIERLCNNLVNMPTALALPSCSALRERDPQSVYRTIDPISINARLYEPFLEMYHKKELPCRSLVLKKGKKAFQEPRYQALLNRLNEGLSFQDLTERLRDCVGEYDIDQKVSEFIDRSIDAGIIVPIIQQEGEAIFRAYRHGEDVLFGCREELMYRKMLSLFVKESGSSDGITRIETEKLLVLFTKIGLKQKILTPYTSNFSSEPLDKDGRPIKILRVKSYLKGPVSLVGSALQHQANSRIPYITNERKALWLTNLMQQNGSLKPNKNRKKYLVGELDLETEKDFSLLTEPEQTFVQNFAELTGKISNPNIDTGIIFDDTDWARVSVTLTLPDTVTAVAAEMELFYNDYDIGDFRSFSGNQHKDYKEIVFFVSSYAFESVHSAVMKIESFLEGRGQALVSQVSFPSNVERRIWLGYFSEELNNHENDNNAFLQTIFYEQKVWSYLLQGIVNVLYLLLLERHKEHYQNEQTSSQRIVKAKKRINESFDTLKQIRSDCPHKATNAAKLFTVYDKICPLIEKITSNELTNSIQILNGINEAVLNTEEIATSIKETICDILGERGKLNDILIYNYAVHINLNACTESQKAIAHREIGRAYLKEIKIIKERRQYAVSNNKPAPSIDINELPQKYKPMPPTKDSPGMWFVGRGPKIELQIASFAMNIFYLLYQKGIDCRVTIFDRLRYETSIRSSSSEIAEYHCNQFNTLMELFKQDVLFPEKASDNPAIIHVSVDSQKPNNSLLDKINNAGCFQAARSFTICNPSQVKTKYKITEYTCNIERKIIMEQETTDFGIITILPEELAAIRKVFELKEMDHRFGERVYYTGYVNSAGANGTRKVVCTQTLAQGEASVINAYNDLTREYQPKIVFLIGIAGGVLGNASANDNTRKELDLCDVVIARAVIDYELRKETESGIEHRGQCYIVNAPVAAVINAFLADIYTNAISSVIGGKNATINVVFDAIGSGNAVIANQLSSIVQWLKNFNSKVAAVEMEATGISSAFYESFSNNEQTKGLLVVRGISDLADVDKALCKAYRDPAAQNAALISKKIMEAFPRL